MNVLVCVCSIARRMRVTELQTAAGKMKSPNYEQEQLVSQRTLNLKRGWGISWFSADQQGMGCEL